MPDKSKFIFIGLAALIVILLFMLFQSFQYTGKLKLERDSLKEEKSSLSTDLASVTNERKQLQENLGKAKKDLEALEAQKSEIDTTLKSLTGERDQLKNQVAELATKLAQAAAKSAKQAPEEAGREQEAPSYAGADVYWAGVLKKKAELELKLEGVRHDLQAAKLENEQLKRDKDKLALDLQSFDTESKDTAREVTYNKKLTDTLTQDLAREKTDKYQILETLKTLKTENSFLRQQLKIIFDRKSKLEQKYAQLQDKNSVLESNMAKMEAFVREKLLQVDSLRDELGIVSSTGTGAPAPKAQNPAGEGASMKKDFIELQPIVVRPTDGAPSQQPSAKTGSVIAVNRDNNFVIVNMGSKAGVRLGATFQIFRNDEPVGMVEVIQVRDAISACDIKSETSPIAVNDSVK